MSGISFGGLQSGLDTNGIVTQLMALERQPVNLLQQRQAQLRKVDDAWGQVNTKLSAVRTALDKVYKANAFASFVSASSSKPEAVVATRTGTPATGATTFSVAALAKAHQISFTGTFAASDSLVGAGQIQIQQGGETFTLDTTASSTISDVARDLNRIVPGATSSVVKVSDGVYRLVLTSKETGTARAITVVGNPPALGGVAQLQAAADAEITIGSGASAITVTRSSNTVTDLIEGVRLDLKATTTDPIQVSVNHDVDAATTAIKAMVDGVNGVLSMLKDLTAYDPNSKKAGTLQGDATARKLAMDLRSALTAFGVGATGEYKTAGSIGINVGRDGLLTLNESKLREALGKDFTAVSNLFSRTSSNNDVRALLKATGKDAPNGDHAIVVTSLATAPSVTGSVYSRSPGSAPTQPITITTDEGVVVNVSISRTTETTAALAAAKIQSALSAAGVTTITASDSGGAIKIAESRVGADIGFTVVAGTGAPGTGNTGGWGLNGTRAGTDRTATIGGLAATVSGDTLTGTGVYAGTVVQLTTNQLGSYGNITVSNGLGGAVDTVVRDVEGSTGRIARARTLLTNQIKLYDDRIADYDVRLASREKTMRRKFGGLESALQRLQSSTGAVLGLLPE